MSVWENIRIIENSKDNLRYELKRKIYYFSPRYNRAISAEAGERFDGATGAIDINSNSWIIHDVLCRDGCFYDGTPCNNLQASLVLRDILEDEGRWFRKNTWFLATWLFGGGKARDNGLW